MGKSILTVISILLLFNIPFSQLTENVFIVVIDGARYAETLGDPTHQYIPKIWNELRPLGTIYTAFYIDGQTSTNPGHASIVTGTWQYISNDGSQRPNQPTLFEYSRKQNNTSATDNYIVLGKTKLNILSYSTHIDYGNSYNASVKTSSSQYDDNVTYNNVMAVIDDYHPELMIINFAETDAEGHSGVWNDYVNAIHKVDNLIYELWNFIQNDSTYGNKTTMFITNDHGRHTTNFANHGDNCEGCRHIMLLAVGPDTPAGVVDSTTRKQIDIAPTTAHLLKFDTPYSTGTVINTAVYTSIATRDSEEFFKVENYTLLQNYPNPFNAATTITYFMGTPGTIQLNIFDAMGHHIRTLQNDTHHPAGLYKRTWDGKDKNGEAVSSGVYFYTLQVLGNARLTKQMVMLK